MAVEFIIEGASIPFTSGVDLPAGSVIVQGSLVGISKKILRAGRPGAITVEGVFGFPKVVGIGTAVNTGTIMFWDAGPEIATTSSGGGVFPVIGKSSERANDEDRRISVLLSRGQKAFLPTDLPNLLFWLDAADGTTLDASSDFDPVGLWQDKSGNNFDCDQITAGFKPTFFTAQQNGLPAVLGDGSDDYMPISFTNKSGTSTSVTANKLVDSGATFDVDNTTAGDRVFNDDDSTETVVLDVDSASTLDLGADIFTSSPKNYTVRRMGDQPVFEVNNFSIFSVIRRTTPGGDSVIAIMQQQVQGGSDPCGAFLDINANRIRLGVADAGSFTTFAGGTMLTPAGPFRVLSAIKNGVNGELFLNGVSDATFGGLPTVVDYITTTRKRTAIMAFFQARTGPLPDDFVSTLNGDIAELMIYSDAKSSGDEAQVHNYLLTKWGLP